MFTIHAYIQCWNIHARVGLCYIHAYSRCCSIHAYVKCCKLHAYIRRCIYERIRKLLVYKNRKAAVIDPSVSVLVEHVTGVTLSMSDVQVFFCVMCSLQFVLCAVLQISRGMGP